VDSLERVKRIISYLSGVELGRIGDEEDLGGEIGLDSLDRLELRMELEASFGIEIPDCDLDRMPATPVGIASYIDGRVSDAA
jgi:acyl carrier protein